MSMKRVLCWATFFWMVLTILSVPKPAFADGVYGVRETPTGLEVDVPKFCRPLRVVWEIRWEENAANAESVLSIMRANNKQSIKFLYDKPGFVKVQTIWGGNETLHIRRLDSNGKKIKIEQLSVLALGGGEKLQNKNNWALVAVDGTVMVTSPPVNYGNWGEC